MVLEVIREQEELELRGKVMMAVPQQRPEMAVVVAPELLAEMETLQMVEQLRELVVLALATT